MFCNIFKVIQQGSCIPEHNNVNSAKSNASPQIHVFTIYCWLQSPITMEIDVKLATYFI